MPPPQERDPRRRSRRAPPVLAAALTALIAAAADGQEAAVPGLYDVAGVAAGDVLNIRAAPDAAAPILGALSPDARGVEVVALGAGDRWARINLAEQSGWVARRYLAARPGERRGRVPVRLSCAGTEPFWRLEIGPAGQVFEAMGAAPVEYGAVAALRAEGRADRWAFRARTGSRGSTAIVSEESCTDGMSDRVFGLGADVILGDGETVRYVSGCCSLAP